MSDEKALPPGWAWTTLDEVADLVGGGTPSREWPNYFTGHIVWLTPTEIPKDRIAVLFDSRERITETAVKESSARILPKGAVLMTSRATIGYVAIAGTEVTTNQGFASFICSDAVFNTYLAYWLWAQREKFIAQATGTTFKEITKSKLRPIKFPLASLPEQRRIVAKIEELFTRLEAGVAALKRVRAALKRYKASVLKAACEGRLVSQDPNDEPAEQLLARTRSVAERRAPRKGGSKTRPDGPRPPDTSQLPELPEGWCWATIGELTQHLTSGSRGWAEYYAETGSLFVRVGNFNRLSKTIDLKKTQFVNAPQTAEANRTRLEKRDLLITMTADVGMVGVVDENTLCWGGAYINQHVGLVRLQESKFVDFVAYALASEIGQKQFREKQYGATKLGLNFEDISSLRIPLPPLAEQHRIVAEVERRLSVVSALEKSVEANLARAARLRQAILHRAFTGRLVPQDPSDEPAEKLLERIRVGAGLGRVGAGLRPAPTHAPPAPTRRKRKAQ